MSKQERDYSHRSLFDKLGVKPNSSVAVAGKHDRAFLDELATRIEKGASTRLTGTYDIVFLRVDAPRDLARLEGIIDHLVADGRVWIIHPKGRGASPSDAEVRAAGLAAGLVDNKISSYSASHTATQYVIPLTKRT